MSIPQKSPAGKGKLISSFYPWRLLRHFLVRPRLLAALLFFLFLMLTLSARLPRMASILISFDSAALLFLVAVVWMMKQATEETMRYRALVEDEGKWVVLGLSSLVAFAVLVSLVMAKNGVATSDAVQKGASHMALLQLALAVLTIAMAWLFINTIFALHYAHDFYSGRKDKTHGLDFPGTKQPDYWDFIYFAFCLGMTFQVSDVEITSRSFRRLATFHSTLAFFFNVFILALSVNIIAGAL